MYSNGRSVFMAKSKMLADSTAQRISKMIDDDGRFQPLL